MQRRKIYSLRIPLSVTLGLCLSGSWAGAAGAQVFDQIITGIVGPQLLNPAPANSAYAVKVDEDAVVSAGPTNAGAYAILGRTTNGGTYNFVNAGQIDFALGTSAPGSLTNIAVYFGTAPGSTFTNNNRIVDQYANPLLFLTEQRMDITNEASGLISGSEVAIMCLSNCNIVNKGRISGAGFVVSPKRPDFLQVGGQGVISTGDPDNRFGTGPTQIDNSGSIRATVSNGVAIMLEGNTSLTGPGLPPSSVINRAGGEISAPGEAIWLAAGKNTTLEGSYNVVNQANALISGRIGVRASHKTYDVNVSNAGTILGTVGNAAIDIETVNPTLLSATNVPGGDISGGTGIRIIKGSLRINNSGRIAGQEGSGVLADNTWFNVQNFDAGLISGAAGITITKLASFPTRDEVPANVIANSGRITGATGAGIDMSFTGVVQSGQRELVTITNATGGAITGVGGVVSSGFNISLDNKGQIDGTTGFGVQVAGSDGATVVNSGLISGAQGVVLAPVNGALVDNTGRIVGTNGVAVSIRGDNNTLRLNTGSILDGDAVANGQDNVVALLGSAIENSVFSGFDSLKMSGAEWTLTGSSVFNKDIDVATGALRVQGQLSASTMLIHGGATLTGTGSIVADVTNAGEIKPGALLAGSAQFGALTIRGNYTGSGGTLRLNTALGGDSSATDRLLLAGGAATGNTIVNVTNVGGKGAATTDGIRVVQTSEGATTAANAFTMNGQVRAGMYSYRLVRGGAGGEQDWFLRSMLVLPPGPNSGGGGGPLLPVYPDTPANELPPEMRPVLEPDVATYMGIQPLGRQMDRTMVGTLNDRRGDTSVMAGAGGVTGTGANAKYSSWPGAAWGRWIGETFNNQYRSLADSRSKGTMSGFQAGLDLYRGDLWGAGGMNNMGVYVSSGRILADASGLVTDRSARNYDLVRTGRQELDAWSGGAYWTHFMPMGGYLDAVLQATRYDSRAASNSGQLKTRGHGLLASLEAGYPVALPVDADIVIEPQAQVIWQRVGFSSGLENFSVISPGTSTGTSARVGVRGKWTVRSESGSVLESYVRVNLWQDNGGRSLLGYNQAHFAPVDDRGRRLEISGGATAKLNDALSMFANVSWEKDVLTKHDQSRRSISGSVGLRYAW